MAQGQPQKCRIGEVSAILNLRGDESARQRVYIGANGNGAMRGRVFKTILALVLAVVVFLVGYGYLVDMTPAQQPVTQPVVLNAS